MEDFVPKMKVFSINFSQFLAIFHSFILILIHRYILFYGGWGLAGSGCLLKGGKYRKEIDILQ